MQSPTDTLVSRFAMEAAIAGFCLAVGGLVTWGSLDFGTGWDDAGPQPGYFPFYVGLIVMIAAAIVLAQALRARPRLATPFLTREQGRRIAAFGGPMLAFVAVSALLGLYVGMTLYLFGVMTVQGGYKPFKAALVSVGSAILFYVVFEIWFLVPLLKGPLEPLFGIH